MATAIDAKTTIDIVISVTTPRANPARYVLPRTEHLPLYAFAPAYGPMAGKTTAFWAIHAD
jgi:hypothetical protein